MEMSQIDLINTALERACGQLLEERDPEGHWVGQLSTSALSTATAVSALSLVREHSTQDLQLDDVIARGVRWLGGHQNDDGGWGDTDRSYSNIATTMLVRAALHLSGHAASHAEQLRLAEGYIESEGGIAGLRRRYGKDKTFAVPILTNCALAGLVPWKAVPALPFELACLPQAFYRFLRLPVVSYAIPALVAIGQVRFFHRRPRTPWMRLLRTAAVEPSLRVLRQIQPASGGYLEAAPLTSFVVMSLAASGRAEHPVSQAGIQFLLDSVLPDGSWPIDTNLAVWTTTLSINALATAEGDLASLECLDWLLACQYQDIHPFTGAAPGAWGWTDLSGAVPDADDTPGALLALAALRDSTTCRPEDGARIEHAAGPGIRWLLDLQNRDGGWPTFCRGWGKLPFDRSGADLTAHVLRAFRAWPSADSAARIDRATRRGFRYLARQQRGDGSWVPLWFGNQDDPAEENAVYGTAKVLQAYCDFEQPASEPARRGAAWLRDAQNSDGGWGGGPARRSPDGDRTSSVEETALAVDSLARMPGDDAGRAAVGRGVDWLLDAVRDGRHREASPIGFYFAKLWYYERLYPLIFTVAALGRARQAEQQRASRGESARG
jgi:squalene-hopene/tetraprenyl-beta-curcumene cyclase